MRVRFLDFTKSQLQIGLSFDKINPSEYENKLFEKSSYILRMKLEDVRMRMRISSGMINQIWELQTKVQDDESINSMYILQKHEF